MNQDEWMINVWCRQLVSESPAPAQKWGKEIRNLRQRSRRYNNRERRPRKKKTEKKEPEPMTHNQTERI